MNKRVFLIVLDSFGIGEMPDAFEFCDEGSNTLKAVSTSKYFKCDTLKKLGLFNIDGVDYLNSEKNPLASFVRLSEKSKGKDTTTGHWEIAGTVLDKPFPTFTDTGFPKNIVDKLEEAFNSKILCNKAYSGTQVILDYGKEHIKTKKPIVYTSADSVLQIACHEEIIPVEKLYEMCTKAREILMGDYAVGRVIARPFTGEYPNFVRTKNRHDFSLVPPKNNMLSIIKENGLDSIAVGKISDIFAETGITKAYKTKINSEALETLLEIQKQNFNGLCFVNLCDFDMLFGHRNDIDGYAKALTETDSYLEKFLQNIKEDDLLIVTADHGCDPSTPSTDHSREYIPCLIYNKNKESENLGTKKGFNHIGATVLDYLNVTNFNNTNLNKDFSLLK